MCAYFNLNIRSNHFGNQHLYGNNLNLSNYEQYNDVNHPKDTSKIDNVNYYNQNYQNVNQLKGYNTDSLNSQEKNYMINNYKNINESQYTFDLQHYQIEKNAFNNNNQTVLKCENVSQKKMRITE